MQSVPCPQGGCSQSREMVLKHLHHVVTQDSAGWSRRGWSADARLGRGCKQSLVGFCCVWDSGEGPTPKQRFCSLLHGGVWQGPPLPVMVPFPRVGERFPCHLQAFGRAGPGHGPLGCQETADPALGPLPFAMCSAAGMMACPSESGATSCDAESDSFFMNFIGRLTPLSARSATTAPGGVLAGESTSVQEFLITVKQNYSLGMLLVTPGPEHPAWSR